ncbi:hypothetical protein DL96DRAFT_1817226, partial [Flagelloscypha sp. PMI_526]
MTSIAISPDLLPIVCSFADDSTLATLCLSNRALCLDARAALYRDISFNTSGSVERFLLRTPNYLKHIRHLSLYIPRFLEKEEEIWNRLFVAVHHDSSVTTLRILSSPTACCAPLEFQRLVGTMLSIRTLQYVAVSASVVSAINAVQCPALKELDIRTAAACDLKSFRHAQGKQPKLNTLCVGWFFPSLSPPQNLFDLSSLVRLAIHIPTYTGEMPILELLAITCETLEELSLSVRGNVDQLTDCIGELRTLAFPNLQTLVLLSTGDIGIDERWQQCSLLSSAVASLSGQRFKELRLYLHNCDPQEILSGNISYIPAFHPMITVIRLYCWNSDYPPPRAADAERILQRRLGGKRDFQVTWS